MSGVDSFVANNFTDHDSTIDLCVQLVVHGYSLLEKKEKYSRAELLKIAGTVRGKKTKQLELEDFLRNDLVTKYIMPERSVFGLNNFMFISGAEEFENNIKTGILDIKVCSPTLDGTIYYIFECKRMNKTIQNGYVTDGVSRFVNAQYYPHSSVAVAGLISFLEATTEVNKVSVENSFKTLENLFKKHQKILKITKPLKKYKLNCPSITFVDGFDFVYASSHNRKKRRGNIDLYHIVLDYNHLVTS